MRCYLGASTEDRKPNAVTGFDPRDEMELATLNTTSGPLHIVNTAVNLVQGGNLAWQQRKPDTVGNQRAHDADKRGDRKLSAYGDSVKFGTAMVEEFAAHRSRYYGAT